MTTAKNKSAELAIPGNYKWGFHDDEKAFFKAEKGLSKRGVARNT